MKIRKSVGIDLGTTHSAIAILSCTDSTFVAGRDEDGSNVIPSVVGYSGDERRMVVGALAARMKGQASGPISSVKRSMGLDTSFSLGPHRLTPAHVSAQILLCLRGHLVRALADSRHVIDSAVITVPATFNPSQLEATREAAAMAGFKVVELLHEPIAAAMYYSWFLGHDDATYLIYDFGGGAFVASVVRKRGEDYELLDVGSDPGLGGVEFDRLLADHLEHLVRNTRGSEVSFDPHDEVGMANYARLLRAAESIKLELSVYDQTEHDAPGLFRDCAGNAVALEAVLDRDTFERIIKAKVDLTVECCRGMLGRTREKTGIRLGDIDHVILTGGSTRIPRVRETVRSAFCNSVVAECVHSSEPLWHEPELCVAYGAALHAARHGTRLIFDLGEAGSSRAQTGQADHDADALRELEVHVNSSCSANERSYLLAGSLHSRAASGKLTRSWEGFSVRIECPATGAVEEAFVDDLGRFAQETKLAADGTTLFDLTVCDAWGRDVARAPFQARFRKRDNLPGAATATVPARRPVLQARGDRPLNPPWVRFGRLVTHCLLEAGRLAERTGRAREELFEQVYSQERYAERAYQEKNQTLYRECFDNLTKLASYLDHLLSDAFPGPHEASYSVDHRNGQS